MKKLMIAAAIVCAVASVKASTVSWGVQSSIGSDFSTGTLTLLKGTASDITTWAALQSKFTIESVTTAMGAESIKFDLVGADTTLALSGGMATMATKPGIVSYNDGQTGTIDVFAIAISSDGTKLAVSSGKQISISSATTPSMALWTGADLATKYTAAVPEPTSGLLLLLGVAGMALRRRRA